MTRVLAAATALLVATPSLTGRGSPPPAGSAAARPKPQAPVTIAAAVGADQAAVTVRFLAAATDVTVAVRGLDGLAVASAAHPISGGRFARDEAATLQVAFPPGAGTGQLVVAVTGTFAGARRFTTATFAVGRAPVERLERATPLTDATGRRVKVMPSAAP